LPVPVLERPARVTTLNPAASSLVAPLGWDCDIPSCCELGEGEITGEADGHACYHETNTVTDPDILNSEVTAECELGCAETISGEYGVGCRYRHFCIEGGISVKEYVSEHEWEDEGSWSVGTGCDHRTTYESTRGPCDCCLLAEKSEVATN
jgi:hypothetical protein